MLFHFTAHKPKMLQSTAPKEDPQSKRLKKRHLSTHDYKENQETQIPLPSRALFFNAENRVQALFLYLISTAQVCELN